MLISFIIYLLTMPSVWSPVHGVETSLFVNMAQVTDLCVRDVLPSRFLAEQVVESVSKSFFFSQKPFPYSCQTSIGTESGHNIIVVVLIENTKDDSCKRNPEQMVVYPLKDVKRYWAKLPPGVTHPPAENELIYNWTTTAPEESLKNYTYTNPEAENVGYLEEIIPIVNITANLKEGIFYEEINEEEQKTHQRKYFVQGEVPIVNVSVIFQNDIANNTAAAENFVFNRKYGSGSTAKATRYNPWSPQVQTIPSQTPSRTTVHLEDVTQSLRKSFEKNNSANIANGVVSDIVMANSNETQHYQQPEITTEEITNRMNSDIEAFGVKQEQRNDVDLPNSTDFTLIPTPTSKNDLENNSSTKTSSSAFPFLRNYSELQFKVTPFRVTPLNTKWWDWRFFTKVTKSKMAYDFEKNKGESSESTFITKSPFNDWKNIAEGQEKIIKDQHSLKTQSKDKILFENNVSTQTSMKTIQMTTHKLNNSQQEFEYILSRLPHGEDQEVSNNESPIKIHFDDTREHLARLFRANETLASNETPVYDGSRYFKNTTTMSPFTPRKRDKTSNRKWNLIQHDNEKNKTFDKMKIENDVNRRSEMDEERPKREITEENPEDENSSFVEDRVPVEALGTFLEKPLLDVCSDRRDRAAIFVGVSNSSRLLLRLANFTMERMLVIITAGRILNPISDSCEDGVECQVAGNRVCVGREVMCDGIPNCGSFNTYDEDKIQCKRANSDGRSSAYVTAVMFLFAFSVLLYMLNYWLRRCVPKVAGAFFIYKDDGDNVLFLNTIMKSPHAAIDLATFRQSTNTVQSLGMDRRRSSETHGQTETDAPNMCIAMLAKIFCCFWKKDTITRANDSKTTDLTERYSYTEMELKRFLPTSVDTGIQTSSSIEVETERTTMKYRSQGTQHLHSNPQEQVCETDYDRYTDNISEKFSQIKSSLDLFQSVENAVVMRVLSEISSVASSSEESNQIIIHENSGVEEELRTIDFSKIPESVNKQFANQWTDNEGRVEEKDVLITGEVDKKKLRFNEDIDTLEVGEERASNDDTSETMDRTGVDETGVSPRGIKEILKMKKVIARSKSRRMT